jgi:AcrR family transcriptional regulator
LTTRVEREKLRRKQEMMLAAEKLFANKGFQNVRMEEIAKESEFTRKTLYAYFANKDDLFRQVFISLSIQRWDFLVKEMEKVEDGIPRIRAYGKANYDYSIANPEHFKLIVHVDQKGIEPQTDDQVFKNQIIEARKEITRLLNDAFLFGQSKGSLRADLDISRVIVQFGISLRSMLNEIILGYEEREFYFDFLELFIQAIKV